MARNVQSGTDQAIVIEYLEECRAVGNTDWDYHPDRFKTFDRSNGFKDNRSTLVKKYAWAIPSQEALETIAKYTKSIIEIGAGTGYWAYLLEKIGVDVICYDINPPSKNGGNEYRHTTQWHSVFSGNSKVSQGFSSRSLMLCWPPYETPMAKDALEAYKGGILIYIGEGEGGCNGDEEFWSVLGRDWSEAESIRIPQWEGIHDYLTIFTRKVTDNGTPKSE